MTAFRTTTDSHRAARVRVQGVPRPSEWEAPTRVVRSIRSHTAEPSEVAALPLARTLGVDTPPNYAAIMLAIESSRVMLTWEDDWDGEGSPGYETATWERATNFLEQSALQLWRRRRLVLPVPDVDPGPSGSVELHWQTEQATLLINVPSDAATLVTFYGDNGKGEMLEGRLDILSEKLWLLTWLAD